MQLNVREAAALLNVSEKTIYRWIKQNHLPVFKIHEQYRFNRVELLEWATSQRINLPANIFLDHDEQDVVRPGIAEALKSGGIYYRIGGTDRNSVLKSAVDMMALPEEVDKSFLLRVLVARETMGSTGIGNGIAIPHVRNPIVMYIPRPIITLCFLEKPVDFGAIDGKPVHTIFTLVSPTISAHLHLLSRLSYTLRNQSFTRIIHNQGTREEILEAANTIDISTPVSDNTSKKQGH